MGDSSNDLRAILSRTDVSAPSIQSSAAAMMRLYDAAPTQAVNEWRSALRTCDRSQLLPLLYVANEVLQTSKRNRGNRFLEAFGSALGGSLRFICERDRSLVEKLRRTAKIWGDRRVYSPRFVGELLSGLEEFRDGGGKGGGNGGGGGGGGAARHRPSTSNSAGAGKSPPPKRPAERPPSPSAPARRGGKDDGGDDDDDFSSPFADSGSAPHLDLDIKTSLAFAAASSSSSAAAGAGAGAGSGGGGAKRRRSSPVPQSASAAATGGGSPPGRKRRGNSGGGAAAAASSSAPPPSSKRRKAASTSSMVDLFERVSALSDRHRSASGALSSIDPRHLDPSPSSVDDVVGDDLLDLSRGCRAATRTALRQRAELRSVASGRREAESDATRYLPWLRLALRTDDEDLEWCDRLASSLALLGESGVHAEARRGRERRLDLEARRRAEEEARRRREEEEAERRRSLESAKKSAAEAKPGMVWNAATREYQYLHDETLGESWRD